MQTTRSQLFFAGGLVLLVFAVYATAIAGGFVWDDDDHVTNSVVLRSVDGLRRIWFEPTATPQYYPLTHTTFWLEYRLWGANPHGYHAVNVLLHGLGACLVWRVLRRLQVPGAAFAAAIFALHPVHVESVAWITERKNVLSGVLFLGAMLAYLRFAPPAEEREPRARGFWLLALGLFLGALASKTTTAGLPAVILVVLWWKRGRLRGRDILPLLPFFVLGAAMGLHTSYLERVHVGAMGPEWDHGLVERTLIAGRACWFYLGKLAWPYPQSFVYPRWTIDAGAWWQYLFPVAAGGLLVASWRRRELHGRAPLAAALVFGGLLLPALGFLDVYPMRYSYVADHFQYLASLGPIALFAAVVTILVRPREHPRRAVVGTALVLLVLGGTTWSRTRAFAGPRTLWEDVIAKNPEAWMAHNNLGQYLLEEGELAEAERHLARAIELKPDHAHARNNLALLRLRQNRLEEARLLLLRALDDAPDLPEIHLNLGKVYLAAQDLERATTHLERARSWDPHEVWARVYLARVHSLRQEYAEAEALLRGVLRDRPDLPDAHLDLGRLFIFRGILTEAARHIDRALELRPDWALALYLRGRIHLDLGERSAAMSCFERAIAADPALLQENDEFRRLWETRGEE